MTQDVGSMIAQAREDQLAKAKAESRALRMNFAKYLVPAKCLPVAPDSPPDD